VNAQNNNGRTALMAAAKNNHTEIIKGLLAKGADLNAKDKNGKTALELAQPQEKTELARLLKTP
jgi:ankyrin repeat protein